MNTFLFVRFLESAFDSFNRENREEHRGYLCIIISKEEDTIDIDSHSMATKHNNKDLRTTPTTQKTSKNKLQHFRFD